ncbi:MAG: HEAT repeat domain-containing protein [Opitutaceae bacterium]|nr:HEAT repeat domain-containing protein [Opitutaceae bacterium]
MKRLFFTFALLVSPSAALAQTEPAIKIANLQDADLSLMSNHDPEVERANLDLLPGYDVNLFAAEPMLANPTHMVWDSRGRLWVTCSWAYPQLKPGAVANDKIIILEDTDGDGRADKSTVFADGLYIPTGLELANGGCYVAQSPDLFFFKDTDGDDVADVKEVALTGFGIEDSHHSIHAYRRGPDGWIYFQEGIFLHTQVETQHGVVRNFNGGVYQFNPRSGELRVFAKINVGNPWGHVFDRWGQSFLVDNPRVGYLSPSTGNSGERLKLVQLLSTEKQCGGDLASGSHLPPEILGQLLTCRFKSRTVVRYEFIEDGAGFSANVLEPLVKSRHPNFRPIDCKIGPDGAIYVADWYNPIINHAQHDFRDPRRDDNRGRIWRITAKNRPVVKKPHIAGASIPALVDHLRSPEDWNRHQARLELSGRDPGEVARELERWVGRLDPTDPHHDHHLVEAMWAYQNIDRPNEAILTRVLEAKDGHARAAGARTLRYWQAHLSDPVALIARAARDSFPRVRMEAVLSAGFVPKAEAFPAALAALDFPKDAAIDLALAQTVSALGPYWRPALAAGKLEFAQPGHREFALRDAGVGFEKRLADFLARDNHSPGELVEIKAKLTAERNGPQLRLVVDALIDRRRPKSRAIMVGLLDALHDVARGGEVKPDPGISRLQRLLANTDAAIAAATARALGAWKANAAAPELLALIRDGKRPGGVRAAAAQALAELERPESVAELRSLAASGDIESRYFAVRGLTVADLAGAGTIAATLLGEDPGKADPAGLVSAFLLRDRGPEILTKALADRAPHPAVAAAVSDFHRRTGQLPAALAQRFHVTAAASLSAALLQENRPALTADVERHGDPVRGERIFRRPTAACIACHAIGTVGPAIGPNLVAVGAGAETSYVVEAILEPNKSIAEHYETTMITTRDGTVRVGVIAAKGEQEIVLRDPADGGKELRIPVPTIREIKTMDSLMPAGLVDQLQSRQEFLDLARFVSLLGRPGPYANDESPVIRKWQIAAAPGLAAPPVDEARWTTAYSYVSGDLHVSDLDAGNAIYARGRVQVQVAGPVRLKLNSPAGLRLWIDGREITDLADPITLGRGQSAFTFRIDQSLRGPAGLRVELATAPGSPAKFQPVGGI